MQDRLGDKGVAQEKIHNNAHELDQIQAWDVQPFQDSERVANELDPDQHLGERGAGFWIKSDINGASG